LICFSIDNKSTGAIDDAISIEEMNIEELDSKYWKIGIHIADLNEFVKQNQPMD